eukprot:217546-Pelagomonas_calceolata.AAC.2
MKPVYHHVRDRFPLSRFLVSACCPLVRHRLKPMYHHVQGCFLFQCFWLVLAVLKRELQWTHKER